jgi:lipoprotein-anchoring transpeptidase ErfK/SrfK
MCTFISVLLKKQEATLHLINTMKSPARLIFLGTLLMPMLLCGQAILVKPNKQAPSEAMLVRPELDIESVPLEKPLETNAAILGKPMGEEAIRLQIFLDQQNFGPGVIDGKPGLFTEQAVKAWNEVHGHPVDDWTAVLAQARLSVPIPLIEVKVPNILQKWVNPAISHDRIAQARAKKTLAYRSVAELMSERYHTDVEFLSEINGSKFQKNLLAESVIKVPNVTPFLIESIAGVKYHKDDSKAARHVVVDTKRNQLRIFAGSLVAMIVEQNSDQAIAAKPKANRSLIATFPITPGQQRFIHYGMWEVRNQVEFPSWRYDKSLLEKGVRSKDLSRVYDLPPGPNSPVGILWCGLNKSGIGLHGTADPETIGRARSAGCIRLANWDAIKLPNFICPGTTVEVR